MPRPQNPLVVNAFSGSPFANSGLPVIVARRAPTTSDRYQIGQIWVESVDNTGTAVNGAWILTSILNNQATWTDIGQSGTAVFANLTVTGTTQLNILNVSGLATFNGSVNMAPTAAGSTITLGNAGMTGSIIIGNSTALAGQAISIGGAINTGAQSISLGSGASAANSTVNILTGNATAGIQTANILTGTQAGAFNLGTGAAAANTITVGGTGANVIRIGNTQTGGSISLGAAMTTGTISIGASTSGLVSVPPLTPAPVASPTATVTANARVGYVVFTGFTTASAGTQTFTIANTTCTAASAILVTAANFGANDAKMTVSRVIPGVNTFDVILINNGAAALNGDVAITFWVLN